LRLFAQAKACDYQIIDGQAGKKNVKT